MTPVRARRYVSSLAVALAVGVVLLVAGSAASDALLRTAGLSLVVVMALLLIVHAVRSGRHR
ncbi:hypothetical protein [Curtobacterium sp. PhB115]|uniref:hypothetical protein n=1 Tax=Curtobacterium sp. PhB115 TaxID=2485173 RepID=UPI0011CDDDA0|nr:hypothetical protein [Curtobacterium sp. PhB115]